MSAIQVKLNDRYVICRFLNAVYDVILWLIELIWNTPDL